MIDIDGKTVVGIACKIGTANALEFFQFAQMLAGLCDTRQKHLLRAWIATCSFPGDADLEREHIITCLHQLAHAWHHEEKKQ